MKLKLTRKWKRTHPQALFYYALALPVIVAEFILYNSYLANNDSILAGFQNIIPPIGFLRIVTETLVAVLPWILIIISVFALLSLRPSLMVTILTIFFLVLVSALGQVDFYLAAIVVFSSFSSLIGFNFARAAKVLEGRKISLESKGPFKFRLSGYMFDLGLPVAGALGVMTIVWHVMNRIRAQVTLLPPPLDTLGTLYLQSHVYLITTTLAVAAAVVWMIRELFEPVVLRYTLTRSDARELAFQQIQSSLGTVYLDLAKARKPRSGKFSVIMYTSLLGLIVAILLISGLSPVNYLLAAMGVGTVQPLHSELFALQLGNFTARLIDNAVFLLQSVLKFIIRILWG
jgi:hypothetical protein